TPFIASAKGAVAPIAWVLAAEHALVVVVAASLLYVLRPQSTLTTRQLRWLELLTLAAPVLTLGTDQFWNMITRPLLEAWTVVQSTYASGWSSYWLLLIILHSVLVPNSWRRCAVIATTLGLIPLLLTVVAEAWNGWPTPAVPLTMFLT